MKARNRGAEPKRAERVQLKRIKKVLGNSHYMKAKKLINLKVVGSRKHLNYKTKLRHMKNMSSF